MKKFSALLFVCTLMVSALSFASLNPVANSMVNMAQEMSERGLNWHVGDRLDYNMAISGMMPINGTMYMEVVSDNADGLTVNQIADLGQFGQQTIEMLMDKNTGEIKRLVVNGKEQAVPDSSGGKILKQEQARVTVPRGTYDCIYILMEDADGNQSEIWINPSEIPMLGMVKNVSSQQGMTVTMELTSFAYGN